MSNNEEDHLVIEGTNFTIFDDDWVYDKENDITIDPDGKMFDREGNLVKDYDLDKD